MIPLWCLTTKSRGIYAHGATLTRSNVLERHCVHLGATRLSASPGYVPKTWRHAGSGRTVTLERCQQILVPYQKGDVTSGTTSTRAESCRTFLNVVEYIIPSSSWQSANKVLKEINAGIAESPNIVRKYRKTWPNCRKMSEPYPRRFVKSKEKRRSTTFVRLMTAIPDTFTPFNWRESRNHASSRWKDRDMAWSAIDSAKRYRRKNYRERFHGCWDPWSKAWKRNAGQRITITWEWSSITRL